MVPMGVVEPSALVRLKIKSCNFSIQINRRYNDFLALNDLLLCIYPYRLIPRLPPAKVKAMMVGVDSTIVDDRLKALKRWINFIASHPVISRDPMIEVKNMLYCY